MFSDANKRAHNKKKKSRALASWYPWQCGSWCLPYIVDPLLEACAGVASRHGLKLPPQAMYGAVCGAAPLSFNAAATLVAR